MVVPASQVAPLSVERYILLEVFPVTSMVPLDNCVIPLTPAPVATNTPASQVAPLSVERYTILVKVPSAKT